MLPSPAPGTADLSTYPVFDLYVAGLRFVSDFDEDAAVDLFMDLHPNADRAEVERELREAIELSNRAAR